MNPIQRLAIAGLSITPKPILRLFASRYIAGEELSDAVRILEKLRTDGFAGILDLLGEEVATEASARHVAAEYVEAARALSPDLDCNISVKPTHVGLCIDEALALENYDRVAAACREQGRFLRVEMEDHTTTEATLRVFEQLRERHENVGIVLQSRLHRTLDDIARLAPGPLNVRLVKGIYLEPAEIAHVDADAIREAFVECARRLFDRGAFIGLATHDDLLADRCLELARAAKLENTAYEFQVLLGVREPLWAKWAAAGERVRVYVPYGPDWRPYSLRRMRKNPQIFQHVLRDMLTPGRR